MTKEQIRGRIEEIGIIPAIRVSSPADALFAAEAVCGHGITIVEITMTVPGAVEIIAELARNSPVVIAGAAALGIGGELVPHEAIRLRQEHWIGELARQFLNMVKEARQARASLEKQTAP